MRYIQVAFPNFNGDFTYHFNGENLVGKILKCPFRNGYKIGLGVKLVNKPNFKTKECDIYDKFSSITFSEEKLKLLNWISDFYISEFHKVIGLALPKWILKAPNPNIETFYEIKETEESKWNFSKKATSLLSSLRSMGSKSPIEQLVEEGFSQNYLTSLTKRNLITKINLEANNSQPKIHNPNLTKLSEEQNKALSSIRTHSKSNKPTLLWGYTGSGKTEIYKHLTSEYLEQGKQILILAPEILLSKSLAKSFEKSFGDNVAVWHSELTTSQKAKLWWKIARNEKQIILGARSAIFAPFENLGLIIMDEEQEWDSYKNEQDPRYHAKRVILKMSELNKIPILLGSATPSVETYYLTTKNLINCVKLEKRYFS